MKNRAYWIILLMLLPLTVAALGFRDIRVDSFLSEPLNARIELISAEPVDPSDIRVALAEFAAFEKAGLERPLFLSKLRFQVKAGQGGRPYIHVTSTEPVREPFLTFLLQVSIKGNRLLREYNILLDPRGFQPAAVTVPSPVTRPAVAVRETQPAPQTYGPVKRSETLWVIAKKLRPDDGITVEQMMMALLRRNPEAFRNDNVNLLRSGSVLAVPARDQVLRLSPKQARKVFLQQVREWKEKRTTPAAKVAVKPQTPVAALPPSASLPPAGGGLIQHRPVENPVSEQGAGGPADNREGTDAPRLRVVEPGKAWGAEALSDQNRSPAAVRREKLKEALADSAGDLAAIREINRDLAELRSVLEAKIETLKQSLVERDQVIETLQKKLDRRVAGGGAVTRSKPDAVLPSGGKDTGAVAAGKPLVPAAEKSAVAPAPAATKPETERWDTAWLLTYWQPLLGLLLILLLLLAVIFILMRRRDTAPLPETPFGGGLAPADQTRDGSREAAVAMDSAAQDAAPDEQGEEAPSDRGTDVSSALTEADIYLAYRRYSQAESLIRKSIERHPQSMVLKAKLLEIYAFRKDKQRFVAFMETVYETMVAVAPAIWAKVVEMGRDLVPEHRLISGSVLPEDELDEDDLGTTAYGLIDEEDDTVILDPDLDDGEKKER